MSVKPAALHLTGGRERGRRLTVPPGIRPTSSRVREALFSIWGDAVEGANWLELFAGSGAVAFEALSRGAARLCLVESDADVRRVLARNARLFAPAPIEIEAVVLPSGLARLRGGAGMPFDRIFADPPYGFSVVGELLAGAAALLAHDGELALEHAARQELPEAAALLRRCAVRRYGDSALTFYRRIEAEP